MNKIKCVVEVEYEYEKYAVDDYEYGERVIIRLPVAYDRFIMDKETFKKVFLDNEVK